MPHTALIRTFEAIDQAAENLRRQSDLLPEQGAAFQEQLDALMSHVGSLRSAHQQQSDARLESSERRYRTLFDSIDEGFCVIEVLFDEAGVANDYRILEANPAFERQTGLQDAIGKRVREMLPGHESDWFRIYGEVALTGQPIRFENPASQINRYYDVYAFRVGVPADRHVAVLFNDVSERKALEQQRAEMLEREQAARQEAERAVALQRVFLGMISHELRTPLASIKGFSSSLLATDITFEPEQMMEFIEIIDHEADRLTELIDQLLDIVRMQAGNLLVVPVVTQVQDILTQAMPQLRILTAQHRLTTDIAPDVPTVLADNQRIAQVLVNLVSNATKFSEPEKSIAITARAVDGLVQVRVADDGIGIPPSEQERVFDIFYQIRRPNRQQGAGLGLAICKGLVESQGGSIWVEDQDGPGTTVCFTLPVAG